MGTTSVMLMTFIGAASAMALAGAAKAGEVTVMSSAAFAEAHRQLAPAFERATGHKVTTLWAGSSDIIRRVEGGEVVDLVIMAADSIDRLTQNGKLAAGSRTDLAKSGIGVAVRAGAPRVDIGSGAGLKAALSKAKSIAYSSGPSGVYLSKLFRDWGIGEATGAKIIQTPPGVPVGDVVARGEAEVGFQQVSELLPIAGIDFLGPLPPDIQLVTAFSAGRHVGSRAPQIADELVRFFRSAESAAIIRKAGMELPDAK